MSITELFFHPTVHALGWTILHSIWQIILIAALWYLAMRMASNSFAAVRYNISLIALLTIPTAFIITFFRQLSVYQGAGQIVSVSFNGEGQAAIPGGPAIYLLDKSHPGFLSHFEAYTQVVCWVYLLGLMVFSGLHLISYSKWYRLKRKHSVQLPEEFWLKAKKISQKLGIRKKVSIRLSDKVDVPLVVGFFKPFVLLPVAILSSLTTEQVEVIILHELYHIRRKDHLVNALQCLIETLFFYHPATWWISKQMRHEREQRVDEYIVQHADKPSLYANALLNIETFRGSRLLQPALAATQSKSKLFIRIKNFMTMKTRKFNNGQKFAALLVLASAMVALIWINPARTINSVKEIGSLMPAEEISHLSHGEKAMTEPVIPEPLNPEEKEPVTIHLSDGKEVHWGSLSDKDREQIMKAIEESRRAIAEINREWAEKLQSGDFQMAMQEAQEELQQGLEELNKQFNRDAFQQELEQARIEFESAMQELRENFYGNEFQEEMAQMQQSFSEAIQQLHEDLSGEELQQELKQVGDAYRLAMKQLNETFHSEEFKESMQLAGETFRIVVEELKLQFGDEKFQQEMKSAGEAFRETMDALKQAFGSEEFRKEIQQAGEALQKALEALKDIEDPDGKE